jgi:hypothetical protein
VYEPRDTCVKQYFVDYSNPRMRQSEYKTMKIMLTMDLEVMKIVILENDEFLSQIHGTQHSCVLDR